MNHIPERENWFALYRVAAITAVLSELVLLFSIGAVMIWPYAPGRLSTEEIFLLLQQNPFGGLISLDLHLVLANLLGIPLFLALYVSLRERNHSYAFIALILGLIATILIVPARPITELLSLSKEYSAANTEVAKSQYLAAGNAVLSQFSGLSWLINTFLGGFSLLVSSLLMLRSGLYNKATAYVGIVTNAAVCLFFIPVVGIFFLMLSVPGYIIWYFQLAKIFFKIQRES